MMSENPAPYYARHKVTELTCPHCKGMMSFLINERAHSVYACACGRWYRAIDYNPKPTHDNWHFISRKEEVHDEHRADTQ